MKTFRRINIIYKVLGSFLVIAVLISGLGIQAVAALRSVLAGTDSLYQQDTQSVSKMMEAVQHYQRTRVILRDILLLDDAADKQAEIENLQSKYDIIDAALSELKTTLPEGDRARLAEIVTLMQAARAYNQEAINAELSGVDGYVILMSEESDSAAGAVQDALNRLEESVLEGAKTRYDAVRKGGEADTTLLIVVLIGCDILAVISGLLLTRMVVKPLLVTAGQIEKLAAGEDADVADHEKLHGEFRVMDKNILHLRAILNRMYDGILLLVDAGTHGKLSVRADTEGLNGYYLDMVQGVNDTLDAVVAPITEASSVLGELSRGNLNVCVEGAYEGDHAIIKDALNATISALRAQISEVGAVLEKLSEGDLTHRVNGEFMGDFNALKRSVNHIIEVLGTMLGDINTAAEQVASGTRQVSGGSQAISQGATEQASSIDELTATVTAIAEQTRQNAIDANRANEISVAARDSAVDGDEKMRRMQRAMQEINEASENIGRVIKVIDDIAFQTNILALNAAVEAARAGAHGKGFAVVAEEVRNLAAKSAQAAKETTALIESSIRKTEAGTKIADETAASLSAIVAGMEKDVILMGGIAAASSEQATAIAQVNKGIEQMSQVVQTNSATAEEAAAASEELSSQAELLKGMIDRFRLGGAKESVAPEALKKPQPKQQKPAQNADGFGKY